MELKYDSYKDSKYIRALCRVLILPHKGQVVSGMSMRLEAYDIYHLSIDHHEFANTLDQMEREGFVEHSAYHGGDTEYKVL